MTSRLLSFDESIASFRHDSLCTVRALFGIVPVHDYDANYLDSRGNSTQAEQVPLLSPKALRTPFLVEASSVAMSPT